MAIIKWREVQPVELLGESYLFLKMAVGNIISQRYASGDRDIKCVVLYPRVEADIYQCRFINEPVTKFEDCEFDLLPSDFVPPENCP
jgi:hypothetical protein